MLSQQQLVKKLSNLIDECEKFSVFSNRNAEELGKLRDLRRLLRAYANDLQKDYVRHNLGQRRIKLIEEWLKGADKMTMVVSTLNMKGGVGKTTLTYNLSWYAAYKRIYKVLVIDLDPQANLTQLFMGDDEYEKFLAEDRSSIVGIFEAGKQKIPEMIHIVNEWSDGSLIHLIPSRLELSTTLKNPTTKERRLARALVKAKEDYDLVLIDCPPTDSILTVASYLASDYLLIPVRPEKLATIGLPLLARSLKDFNEEYADEHEVKVAGVVLNDVDPDNPPENQKSIKTVKAVSESFGWTVFLNEVRNSRSYPTGTRFGKPIFLAPYVRDYVTKEFYQVGDEFLKSVGLL